MTTKKNAAGLALAGAAAADKPRRKGGRPKGSTTPRAQVQRQEKIKEALDYRRQDFTYSQIAEAMECSPSTAYQWVQEGLRSIPQESAEELRKIMFDQCQQVMQRLMLLLEDGVPADVIDGIIKVQRQMMRITGIDGIRLGGGDGDDDGEGGEAVVIARIKASAPVLRPDGPAPANPIL